jgi:hypothetical protein
VTFVQRFGGAINLNIHLHSLILDGVYYVDAQQKIPSRHLCLSRYDTRPSGRLPAKPSTRDPAYFTYRQDAIAVLFLMLFMRVHSLGGLRLLFSATIEAESSKAI